LGSGASAASAAPAAREQQRSAAKERGQAHVISTPYNARQRRRADRLARIVSQRRAAEDLQEGGDAPPLLALPRIKDKGDGKAVPLSVLAKPFAYNE
jgi:hypothetical protein